MHAVPKQDEKSKIKLPQKSRMETLKDRAPDCPQLELPELEGFSFLIDYLFEVGPGITNGMGYCGLSFQEIESWLRTTALTLTAWEVLALKRLSSAYVSEYNRADDPKRRPPYVPEGATEKKPDNSQERLAFYKSLQETTKKRGGGNGSGNVGNRSGQPKSKIG